MPGIWMVEGVGQPFVWGLVRGNIYVPQGFFANESRGYRRDVLAHELSHVARCDAAVNTLQVMVQGLFWFHPFNRCRAAAGSSSRRRTKGSGWRSLWPDSHHAGGQCLQPPAQQPLPIQFNPLLHRFFVHRCSPKIPFRSFGWTDVAAAFILKWFNAPMP